MHHKKKLFSALSLSAFAAASVSFAGLTAADDDYTIVDLSPKIYKFSQATAVNGDQIVGWAEKQQGGVPHPLLWMGNPPHMVDLNNAQAGFVWSEAEGVCNHCQAGWGRGMITDDEQHAVFWNGNANSEVDLNPAGFMSSQAYGMAGNQEVGYGRPINGGRNHALLWTGTAQSTVDLNPPSAAASYANATDGVFQVGFASDHVNFHAILWKGSAASAVDLNPPDYYFTEATGVGGGQQVGFGYKTNGGGHALLWTGTAASFVDLNPPGYQFCMAEATNGRQQVGWGYDSSGTTHALLWNGSAKSAVDLNDFLPDNFDGAHALDIDAEGNIVGYARDNEGRKHAIEWVPVKTPDPAAAK